ncbi:hypothetical protein C8J57DRAFT_1541281 [Mycena rebaudengoi]|nr:hypothetical protein C8J57DRAFT_1541281 [Mycena rebaudengoi]
MIRTMTPQESEANITSTHHVTQLPAYDIGKLLQPESKTLMGAVVHESITLRHWNIGSKEEGVAGRDSYAADTDSSESSVPQLPF